MAVTRLGLGLAPIGGLYSAVGDEQAYATVERAWELGIRYFDTAPHYGIGALRAAGRAACCAAKPREEFTLSTKVGRRLHRGGTGTARRAGPSRSPRTPCWDFSAEGART